MTTLLLRLAGPLQAWGDGSRFTRRDTAAAPTKSGVLGMLAAAQGRRRSDSVEDLANLRFGVRIDQPGRVMRDFQTAIDWTRGESMPLSSRYYIQDAVFVAGVEGEHGLLSALAHAIDEPHYPLFLGRRSCPTTGRVNLGLVDEALENALAWVPWQASRWYQRTVGSRAATLSVVVDTEPTPDLPTQSTRDVPISFDVTRRQYAWRDIAHLHVANPHPAGRGNTDGSTSVAGNQFFQTVVEA